MTLTDYILGFGLGVSVIFNLILRYKNHGFVATIQFLYANVVEYHKLLEDYKIKNFDLREGLRNVLNRKEYDYYKDYEAWARNHAAKVLIDTTQEERPIQNV